MSVGIVFIVGGAAVQPPVFSAISASLFTHLMGARIKYLYLVTTHERSSTATYQGVYLPSTTTVSIFPEELKLAFRLN